MKTVFFQENLGTAKVGKLKTSEYIFIWKMIVFSVKQANGYFEGVFKMSNPEELTDKGIELFNQGNYYDAMTNFTKVYNMTGNIRALMLSAKASFQHSLFHLKNNQLESFETFSRNAINSYKICIKYTNSEEIKQEAAAKIGQIEQLHREVDELKKQVNK